MNADLVEIKPVIKELVRTRVCPTDVKLLVDRVSIVRLAAIDSQDYHEAYRLHLTDRQKSIQAIVKRRLHKNLNNDEIGEGSIVVLKHYELAKGERLHGGCHVLYLRISDFYSFGHDERSGSQPLVVDDYTGHVQLKQERQPKQVNQAKLIQENAIGSNPTKKRTFDSSLSETDLGPGNARQKSQKAWGSDFESALMTTCVSEHSPNESITPPIQSHIQTAQSSPGPIVTVHPPMPPCQITHVDDALTTDPICLASLASLTGRNASKNEIKDVLVVIVSVDSHTFKPPRMPRKRDIRVMDPSTSKRVILSVFTDPVSFQPNVGTVALFRRMTTHDWDGGNLKAYPWLCEGKNWFLPNPGADVVGHSWVAAMREFEKKLGYQRAES